MNRIQMKKRKLKEKKEKVHIKKNKDLTEIHISGDIDSFLFGKLKDEYYTEVEKSQVCFKDITKTPNDFINIFFSLFLENDPFNGSTNLEVFKQQIELSKFEKNCPEFFKIFKTIWQNPIKEENLATDPITSELGVKTEYIRSSEWSIHSFLEEILDSPSHLSQNNDPNFCNQLRVFWSGNFIEIFSNGKKTEEGQLDKFLSLKEQNDDLAYFNVNFKFTDKQKAAFNNLKNNKLSCYNNHFNPIATTKSRSVQIDGLWPSHFFKFVLGDSPDLFEIEKFGYKVHKKHMKYDNKREIRVIFSNVSKCKFLIEDQIDFEKLQFLRYGTEEICRKSALQYDDNVMKFNAIAYDGKLIKPEETIYSDKGIVIDLMSKNNQYFGYPSLYDLFID